MNDVPNLEFLDDEPDGNNIQPAKRVSFLRSDDHDLAPLLKALKKVSRSSVKRMIEALSSNDEKVAMEAAKFLLNMQVNVSREINTDAMNRTIAEIRYAQTLPAMKDIPSHTTPMINFNEIQDV